MEGGDGGGLGLGQASSREGGKTWRAGDGGGMMEGVGVSRTGANQFT